MTSLIYTSQVNKIKNNMQTQHQIINRQGLYENLSFDKIFSRITQLSKGLQVDPVVITTKTIQKIRDVVHTSELDNIAANEAANHISDHIDYDELAVRLIVSNMHKNNKLSFSQVMSSIYDIKIINQEFMNLVNQHQQYLDNLVQSSRDYDYDFMGMRLLQKQYLLDNGNPDQFQKIQETPQFMYLRTSISLSDPQMPDFLDQIKSTYDALSLKKISCPTPVYFNAGTRNQQFASCFLLGSLDSIPGMYGSVYDIAQISKQCGGIGIHLTNIRAKGSRIGSTNRLSDGIIPYLRVLNQEALHINQGGRRAGSIAVYLEPWHAEFMEFIHIRRNFGHDETRCRDLFSAAWIPDIFMKRIQKYHDPKLRKKGETIWWTMLCPHEYPKLLNCWGDEFEKNYLEAEKDAVSKKEKGEPVIIVQKKIQDVLNEMIQAQIEKGTPYMLFKDSANAKSNQQYLGCINSSNLCSEIVIHSNFEGYGVCNLSSLCLPSFIDKNNNFDYNALDKATRILVRNVNRMIDVSLYPVQKTEWTNKKYRPIGIGTQGLADVFFKKQIPFVSDEAKSLNKKIWAQMYYSALDESSNLTDKYGTYQGYDQSPLAQNKLQFDLWNDHFEKLGSPNRVTPHQDFDWSTLKQKIQNNGCANSLLICQQPTASTSVITGFTEQTEPVTQLVQTRRLGAGEFMQINKYLIRTLCDLGLWNLNMFNTIYKNDGSIKDINQIPQKIQDIYKTVWEIKQIHLLQMNADRGIYICQSQSQNIYLIDPNYEKLAYLFREGWTIGLKTGMYYFRTRSKATTQKFGLQDDDKNKSQLSLSCSINDSEKICESCQG